MNNYNDMKMAAEKETKMDCGYASPQIRNPSLQERLENELHSLRNQVAQKEAVEELLHLLKKHPDVARILTLLKETNF